MLRTVTALFSRSLKVFLAAAVLGVPAAWSAPWTESNAAWNVNLNRDKKDPSQYYGAWPGHTYFPSPPDWRAISIYHVITDRVSDGDPKNNESKFGGYDLTKVTTRHGGDFVGLTSKLDYIKSLGFDAILISPIFQAHENEYHGYGQLDFTLLDERFGTLEEFRALVDGAHHRGMYVIVDIVVNHMSDLLYPQDHSGSAAPFRFHTDEYFMYHRSSKLKYEDFEVVNEFDPDAKYCDVYGYDGKRYQDPDAGTFADSDFHHNGDLTNYYDPWNIHLGQIYGKYNDLRLCSPRVQNKIIAMTKALISSADIDAIRIDTPMQVPYDFFQKWTPAVKQHAASLGKKDFFMFGETYTSREHAANLLGRGKTPDQAGKNEFISAISSMDGGIHYTFYKALILPVIRDQIPGAFKYLRRLMEADRTNFDLWDPVHGENRYRMINFFNNHDQRRLATSENGFAKTRLATVLTAFWPGIPMYYFGDEQGFCSYGSALDGHAREDLMTSIAWNQHPAAVTPNPAGRDNFDMTSPHYKFAQQVFSLRRLYREYVSNDELGIISDPAEQGPGVFVFSRGSSADPLVIAINTASEKRSLLGRNFLNKVAWEKGERVVNLLDLREVLAWGKDGSPPSLSFAPFEAKILLPARKLKSGAPTVTAVLPAHDAVVPLKAKVPVSVTFSEPMNLYSIKQNVRFNGAAIAPDALKLDRTNRILSFEVPGVEGISTIEVSEGASAAGGVRLAAGFHARFRIGGADNILINRDAVRATTLVEDGALIVRSDRAESDGGGKKIRLHHHAVGAKFFRIRFQGDSRWWPWQPYAEFSEHKFPAGGGWKDLSVQYWVDGSAAYIVKAGFDFVVPDGVILQAN